MNEKPFENKIKKYLKDNNCWFIKIWGGGFQRAGIPDLLTCISGRFVAIEVKGSNGEPSELQKWNIRKIKESGGIGVILYPEDWENFKKIIDELLGGD